MGIRVLARTRPQREILEAAAGAALASLRAGASGAAYVLAVLAERQWQDYQMRTPGTCFANRATPSTWSRPIACRPRSTAHPTGGDHRVGYKVGCTGPGTTQQFGMAGPIPGFLFQSRCTSTERRSRNRRSYRTTAATAVDPPPVRDRIERLVGETCARRPRRSCRPARDGELALDRVETGDSRQHRSSPA